MSDAAIVINDDTEAFDPPSPYTWTHKTLSTKLMAAVGDGYYFVHLGQEILRTRQRGNLGLTSASKSMAGKVIRVGHIHRHSEYHVYASLDVCGSQIELYYIKNARAIAIKWEDLKNRVALQDIRYLLLHLQGVLKDDIANNTKENLVHPAKQGRLQKDDKRWFRALISYYFLAGGVVKKFVDYPGFFDDLKKTCVALHRASRPTVESMKGFGPHLVRKAIVSGQYFRVATQNEGPQWLSRPTDEDILEALISPATEQNQKQVQSHDAKYPLMSKGNATFYSSCQ